MVKKFGNIKFYKSNLPIKNTKISDAAIQLIFHIKI